MKSFACAVVLLGMLAAVPVAGAYNLIVTATGDDFLTISANGGSYVAGPNWAEWEMADFFDWTIPDGQEISLIFHVRNAFGLNAPNDPGAFMAQLDLEGALWESGSSRLLTNLADWEYSLADPLLGPTAWYEPASGWESSYPSSSLSPQLNGSGLWYEWADGPLLDFDENAAWLWAPQNFSTSAPGNTWWRTTMKVKKQDKPTPPEPPVPSVPEPGSVALMALGVLALTVTGRKKL
jgi:hypothetical protein